MKTQSKTVTGESLIKQKRAMARAKPVTMVCVYRPRKGKEKKLLTLLRKHWPTLRREGLVTPKPAQVWKATDKRSKRIFFLETFQWKDGRASDLAHETPAVWAVWGPMEALLEKMELAVIEPA